MKRNDDFSHLNASDNAYIDSMYETYLNNPSELDESWQAFFKGFEFQMGPGGSGDMSTDDLQREFNCFRMIQSYRTRGHLLSDTNPIRPRRDRDARISIAHDDLSEDDYDRKFYCGNFVGLGVCTLREIEQHMKNVYCGKIGIEYMHSNHTELRRWVRERFEKVERRVLFFHLRKRREFLRSLIKRRF